MAQAKEGENRVTRHAPMQLSNCPIDLLPSFVSTNHFGHKYQPPPPSQEEEEEEEADDEAEIELSLGLSLNGRFGVDPTRANNKNKLTRSSSIPDFLNPTSRDNDAFATAIMIPTMRACSKGVSLIRTCSLPTGTEEEWRKRKELQTLRRMEAKRKRSEKKAARDRNRVFGEENGEEDVKREDGIDGVNVNYQRKQYCVKFANINNEISLPFGGLKWVNGGEKRDGFINGVASQGSIGSQGSGSSGISEFESQPAALQGITN